MKQVIAMTQLCTRYFARSREYKDVQNTAFILREGPVGLVAVGDTYMAMTIQCHMGNKRM